MSDKHIHETRSYHTDESSYALKDIQILEYAYTTFKQYGYQNLIGTFEEAIKHQFDDK